MQRLNVPDISSLSIMETLAAPIWIFDIDQHAIWWGNAAALAFWKVDSLDALRARDFSSDSETVRQRVQQIAHDPHMNRDEQETWILYPDNTPVAALVKLQPVTFGQGRLGLLAEITNKRGADFDIHTARIAETIRYSGVILSMFSLSGRLIAQNPEAFECYGAAQGSSGDLATRFGDKDLAQALLQSVSQSSVFSAELTVPGITPERTHYIKAHRGRDPATGAFVAVISESDISDLVRLRRELSDLNMNLVQRVLERSEALRVSEERFALAMRGANDGLWDRDFGTGETYVSPRCYEMLGMDPEHDTLDADVYLASIHPEDRALVQATFVDPGSPANTVREAEFRARHKDGHWVDLLERAFVVVRDGKPVRMVGTSIDISERKHHERKMKRLTEILVEGGEALPLGVAFYDPDFRLVMHNQLYADLQQHGGPTLERGIHFREILEGSVKDIAKSKGYDNPKSYIDDRLESARIAPQSWTHEQANGRIIIATEIPTSGNGVISLFEDVSQKWAQQKQLHQAQKMEAIGQLTGGVAHDFNNLLAVIMGNLELLQVEIDTQLPGVNTKETDLLIEAALASVKHGSELTSNMLAYARKARLQPVMLDINKAISETERWMRRTIASNIQIETVFQGGVWPILVDQSSLQSALINLILNARDAMEGGGRLTIETANLRIDESYLDTRSETIPPGRYVMVAISDTGPGISPELIGQIFDPFFSTKEVGKGTGLGLSMVEGFVKQSGGMIRVYSEPGSGTSFKMFFSARAQPTTPAEKTPTSQTRLKTAPDSRDHILIAEDQPEVMDVLKKNLASAGYNVTTAANGDTAFEVFQSDPGIDLVLTDIVMPGRLQGPALAKACRELRPEIPFIFLSGYASEATVHGNGLRPEDVRLMKPVSRVALLQAVENCLKLARRDG
ncbi:ATP-binding protein [Pseudorhodobacter aquimaris]|uniref:ATP-binding protein n=1 Tax=Pseudorhodobacter aquimaris TaxID=687412 RepID=UPI00067D221E|nr:ATP-binding protein [Pseudorhodobacter aquimaris]